MVIIQMEKLSLFLGNRNMQIKITLSFCLIPVKMAVSKSTINSNYRTECKEIKLLCTVLWECKLIL